MNALLSYSDSGGEAGEPGPQAALPRVPSTGEDSQGSGTNLTHLAVCLETAEPGGQVGRRWEVRGTGQQRPALPGLWGDVPAFLRQLWAEDPCAWEQSL